MVYQRKNFDGAWVRFHLNKEEAQMVGDMTVKWGLAVLKKIDKISAEKQMVLKPEDRLALLGWFANTYDSFASDYIEAKVDADKKKAAEASSSKTPPTQ